MVSPTAIELPAVMPYADPVAGKFQLVNPTDVPVEV